MPRLIRLFALGAYAAMLAASIWFVAFVLDLGPGKTVNRGAGFGAGVWGNGLLVLLFCSHHSLLARASVKRWLVHWLPAAAERSVYVAFASGWLLLLMAAWTPLPTVVLQVDGSVARTLVLALNGLGWLIVIGSTFQIDHGALFGLRQAWGKAAGGSLRTPWMYRWVRHPMMFGFLVVLWIQPALTVGQLQLAGLLTLYIVVGSRLEERDLLRAFGDAYRRYRREVPALMPHRAPHWPAKTVPRPTATSGPNPTPRHRRT